MKWLLVVLTLPVLLGSCSQHLDQEPLPTAPTTSAAQERVESGRQVDRKPVIPRRFCSRRVGCASVVPIRLEGNTLVPPSDPSELGWWGQKAGSDQGTTLLVGHTVHTGGGFLNDLMKVPVGASAAVSGHLYTVVSNRVVNKRKVAQIASKLFSQTGPPRLVVVTCTGYHPETGLYDSNVVMVAQ